MSKKHLKKGKNNSFFEDEKGISAGGVPVISKRKKGKQIEDEESIKPNPKILILCEGQTEVNYFKGITKSKTYGDKTSIVYTATVSVPIVQIENSDKKYQFNQVQNLIWFAIRVIKETQKETNKNKNFFDSIEAYLKSICIEEEEDLNKLKNFCDSTSGVDRKKLNQLKQEIDKKEKELKESRQYKEKYLNSLLKGTDSDINNPFDQIWLVCDNDDNKNEKTNIFTTIFEKTKEFGINVAYSNRQFENWILLHFEQNQHIFLASECKNCLEGSKQIKQKYSDECRCGFSDFSKNKKCVGIDCKGTICIGGYLRENKLHISYKKGDWRKENGGNGKCTQEYCYEGLFDLTAKDLLNVTQTQEKVVFEKIRTAIQNAEWLRTQQGNPLPENSKNPYTDVDKLVKLLINS